MITLVINDIEYEIPQKLPIEKWAKIIQFDFMDPSFWPHIISAACGAPVHKLLEAPKESIELGMVFLSNILNDRKKCKLKKPLNELTFGEFIDLDVYVIDGLEKRGLQIVNQLGLEVKLASEAQWIIETFIHYRTHIYREYKELFGLDDIEKFESVTESQPVTAGEVARSWFNILYDLSNDNVLNIDPITDLPLKTALNFMAIRKEKKLEEIKRIKALKI